MLAFEEFARTSLRFRNPNQVVTFWCVPAWLTRLCSPVTTMKITPVRGLLFAGALCALTLNVRAQIIELRATINQAQENPPTGSPATGTAIMFYNVATNKFDLVVSITGMANLAISSHIHEGAVGTNGGVVTNLGADVAYVRTGN